MGPIENTKNESHVYMGPIENTKNELFHCGSSKNLEDQMKFRFFNPTYYNMCPTSCPFYHI